MKEWFCVEEIDEQTFAISEYRHWEETHCYLLLGSDRALLVDTGLGVSSIRPIVETLTSLPVIVALTHAHWDHIGGLSEFSNVMVQEEEAVWISERFPLPLAVVKQNLMKEPCEFPDGFKEDAYQLYQGIPSRILKDNDTIDLGNRWVTAIHTPGHSPGHLCFFEKISGYLFSGDLIYAGCLDAFYPTTDPKKFKDSLHKVENLDIVRILPGHHSLRIDKELLKRITKAFDELDEQDLLWQGAGYYSYGDFSIHL